MRQTKTVKMAQTAILAAIILVMSFTPLGYLRTAGLEVSLITIPVAIGAMVVGPEAGAFLGLLFGATSFYQCFGMSPFGAALLGINPFFTFLVCVPTRMLMGWLTGWIFKALYRLDRSRTISYFIGGLLAAVLNTAFFMGMLMLCFWESAYIQELNTAMGGLSMMAFLAAFVGVNGLLEAPSSCILGGIISKALDKIVKRA